MQQRPRLDSAFARSSARTAQPSHLKQASLAGQRGASAAWKTRLQAGFST